MKKALLCLVLLAFVVVSASANNNPTVSISPSPVGIPVGGTQLFTATFSDGSHVQSCSWLATGNNNAVQSVGSNTAIFAAGTLKATYVITANCINSNGVQAMGLGVIGIY
jgi:hypothetical protein